jgi:hypothetical protein
MLERPGNLKFGTNSEFLTRSAHFPAKNQRDPQPKARPDPHTRPRQAATPCSRCLLFAPALMLERGLNFTGTVRFST